VLLLAGANVANRLLGRGRARTAALSLRSALGAGRRRVVQLVLIESVRLAAAGGATGVLIAVGAVRAIAALGRRVVPLVDGVSIDLTVVAFAAAVSLACALAFGVLPATQAANGSPARLLGQAGRTTGSRRQARLRDVLVTVEVALCLVLLVGTGLMIRSFGRLSVVDPGYATNGVTTFTISLPGQIFGDPERRRGAYDEIRQRLEDLPGVTHVARVSQLPLSGSGPLQPYAWDAETAENWESVTADQRMVTSGFFEAIGATFVAGRDFTEDEVRSGARVIVVDDRLAARAFPEGAVGRRLQVESNGTPEPERFAEIIGVVRHLRLHDLSRPHLTQIYSPAWPSGWQSYVVRSAPGAGPLAAAIEREVAAVVPTAPVDGLATMSSLAREALAPARFALVLMLAFGAVAVLLAGVGIYGVLAFAVTQRTREIGLRMALGQAPADARRQVLLHGARLVGVALALGLVAAVAAGQGVSHLLFGVSPLDPTTYAAACVSLAGLAMFACWVPARRATRVDPVQALRAQ
jgi:putative ABC transport system permease protein